MICGSCSHIPWLDSLVCLPPFDVHRKSRFCGIFGFVCWSHNGLAPVYRILTALGWIVLVADASVEVFYGQITKVSVGVFRWNFNWVMVLEAPKPLSILFPLIIDTPRFSNNDLLTVPRIFTPTITDGR